jgi:hypothetical protein
VTLIISGTEQLNLIVANVLDNVMWIVTLVCKRVLIKIIVPESFFFLEITNQLSISICYLTALPYHINSKYSVGEYYWIGRKIQRN